MLLFKRRNQKKKEKEIDEKISHFFGKSNQNFKKIYKLYGYNDISSFYFREILKYELLNETLLENQMEARLKTLFQLDYKSLYSLIAKEEDTNKFKSQEQLDDYFGEEYKAHYSIKLEQLKKNKDNELKKQQIENIQKEEKLKKEREEYNKKIKEEKLKKEKEEYHKKLEKIESERICEKTELITFLESKTKNEDIKREIIELINNNQINNKKTVYNKIKEIRRQKVLKNKDKRIREHYIYEEKERQRTQRILRSELRENNRRKSNSNKSIINEKDMINNEISKIFRKGKIQIDVIKEISKVNHPVLSGFVFGATGMYVRSTTRKKEWVKTTLYITPKYIAISRKNNKILFKDITSYSIERDKVWNVYYLNTKNNGVISFRSTDEYLAHAIKRQIQIAI